MKTENKNCKPMIQKDTISRLSIHLQHNIEDNPHWYPMRSENRLITSESDDEQIKDTEFLKNENEIIGIMQLDKFYNPELFKK
jgi:hypothetical protein